MSSPQLQQYRERMQFYIDLLGGRCRNCGAATELEFDHIDPSTKSFTITVAVSQSADQEMILAELEKCQLLCKKCHLVKTLDTSGRAQHGTAGMYRHHGCRCELCLQSRNDYMVAYYKKRMLQDPNYRRNLRRKV